MKHKIFILRCSKDLLYLEEFNYDTHEQRYEYTKDIDEDKIFEPEQLDLLLEKNYQLNRL